MYILYQISVSNWKLKQLIDDNLRTDYGRIQLFLKKSSNIDKLYAILETNCVDAEVVKSFSIDKIHEPKNFMSMLYYLGLVTIEKGADLLRIPNYSVKTMYWEYMEYIISEDNPEMAFDPSIIYNGLKLMAFDGNYEKFFKDFHDNFVSYLSNIDLEHLSEKNIKFLLLSVFIQTKYYLPISETENSKGYTDVYLQRRNYLYPEITTDWVLELKYIKQSEANSKDKKKIIEDKKKEAKEQLERYKTSNLFKDRKDVRYLMIIFEGKNNYLIEEI
jgi:hypothetical protein